MGDFPPTTRKRRARRLQAMRAKETRRHVRPVWLTVAPNAKNIRVRRKLQKNGRRKKGTIKSMRRKRKQKVTKKDTRRKRNIKQKSLRAKQNSMQRRATLRSTSPSKR